ncbi:MAG: SDR family NAD(P)-dependent oxidoreductase [Vicinamibacterales bacterium]
MAYGVAKAAIDKMSSDIAVELAPHGVAVVSLYPGLVRTEKVMEAAAWLDLTNSESPEFVGRAIAALAVDPKVMNRTETVRVAARLALEYGRTDVERKAPASAHARQRLSEYQMKKHRPTTAFEIVRTVGLALPDVEAMTNWAGLPVLKARGPESNCPLWSSTWRTPTSWPAKTVLRVQ